MEQVNNELNAYIGNKMHYAHCNVTYRMLTGRDLVAETSYQSLDMEEMKGGWIHEATRRDNGDMLFCRINLFYRSHWQSVIVKRQSDGSYQFFVQERMPAIRITSKSWTLTLSGFENRQPYGRG